MYYACQVLVITGHFCLYIVGLRNVHTWVTPLSSIAWVFIIAVSHIIIIWSLLHAGLSFLLSDHCIAVHKSRPYLIQYAVPLHVRIPPCSQDPIKWQYTYPMMGSATAAVSNWYTLRGMAGLDCSACRIRPRWDIHLTLLLPCRDNPVCLTVGLGGNFGVFIPLCAL